MRGDYSEISSIVPSALIDALIDWFIVSFALFNISKEVYSTYKK